MDENLNYGIAFLLSLLKDLSNYKHTNKLIKELCKIFGLNNDGNFLDPQRNEKD